MNYIEEKIKKYFKFEKILNTKNIDDFINATNDLNKIHNSKLYKKPIVPGFQLDSLIEKYSHKRFATKDGIGYTDWKKLIDNYKLNTKIDG